MKKHKAVVELKTRDNKTVVLRFHNLTFKEAQSFCKLFDKFDHIYSDAGLIFHGWSESGLSLMDAVEIEKE